jgi:uncharacterized protein (DUF433 family)
VNIKHIDFPEGVPLIDRYEGSIRTIRVIGSRITLETLVGFFQQGQTVEDLARGFPTLSLAQIKSVIDWYLAHQREADEYLEDGEAVAEALWNKISSKPEYIAFHEELLRRRDELLRQRAQLSET